MLDNSKSDWIGKLSQIYEQNKPVILENKNEIGQEKEVYPHCDDYLGIYEHPGYGNIEINTIDQHLTITYGDITSPLQQEGNDCFIGIEFAFSGKNFIFSRNHSGKVHKICASLEPTVKPIEFKRKK